MFVLFEPSANAQGIQITLVDAQLIYNQHVGNEWAVWIEVDERIAYPGETIELSRRKAILTANAHEGNEKYDDLGQTSVEISQASPGYKEISVLVRENHGRFAGGQAKWTFIIKVE